MISMGLTTHALREELVSNCFFSQVPGSFVQTNPGIRCTPLANYSFSKFNPHISPICQQKIGLRGLFEKASPKKLRARHP